MGALNNNITTFEEDVYNSISKCLGEDETLIFDKIFNFRAPKGVKKLEWPEKTVIEVKYRLINSSFFRIRSFYDKYQLKKLIVIVLDESYNLHGFEYSGGIKGRDIEILSYDNIREKVASLEKKYSDVANKINKVGNFRKGNDANIINKVKDVLKEKKISLFLGAGVSASAGVVAWNDLLEQLCIKKDISKIDNDIENVVKGRYIIGSYEQEYRQQKETDISKLQTEINQFTDRQKIKIFQEPLKYISKDVDLPDSFYHDMRSILYANTRPSKLIESIANLITKCKIESIISYNYDDLVEQEVNKTYPCYSVYAKTRPFDGNCFHIYHVHGFIPKDGEWSEEIVLGEREYHRIYQESYNWGNVEQLHALCRSTCFFIGLSMSDPNLRRLIDISLDGSDLPIEHYAFLRRIEYNVPFMEKIMRSFGVNCIWYDNHKDLPDLLRSLLQE